VKAVNYAQVTYRLYVGSHPQSMDDIETLEKILAITAILNLQTDEDMAGANLNWQMLESHYRTCAVSLCRMPMKEEQLVLREKLLSCVDRLDDLLAAGHTVYLHCTAGIGRSPTGHRLSPSLFGLGNGRRCPLHEAASAMFTPSRGTAVGDFGPREARIL